VESSEEIIGGFVGATARRAAGGGNINVPELEYLGPKKDYKMVVEGNTKNRLKEGPQ